MIISVIGTQFIGNWRVQINVNQVANNLKGGYAQIISRDIAIIL